MITRAADPIGSVTWGGSGTIAIPAGATRAVGGQLVDARGVVPDTWAVSGYATADAASLAGGTIIVRWRITCGIGRVSFPIFVAVAIDAAAPEASGFIFGPAQTLWAVAEVEAAAAAFDRAVQVSCGAAPWTRYAPGDYQVR